ncbi:MAG: dTDP-4-amino-4,6-dideoxygalactose transaminase [Eggerthellaceae bacterium]|nr:dTDP-4-amino-4,6-dideoxygalactose transaminase [Eggerthellaceae bacterium]
MQINHQISFNVPPFVGSEFEYIKDAIDSKHISGDGKYTKLCSAWIEENIGAQKCLLTTSCSTALEMAARLCEIKPGDEVIVPSFTFSTTTASFVNLGAELVFVDIRPDTMDIDENLIEAAITEKTKVIVPVHYAGVACEMDKIIELARINGLLVVEDAAQAMMCSYHGRQLGTIGDFGCYSFHESKNFSSGEGGALLINNPDFNDRAEIIRQKGTNRACFFRGQVDKYTWVDYGGSYLPSDINAAYLWAQLQIAGKINENRLATWCTYTQAVAPYVEAGLVEVQVIPDYCKHNAHMFYLKLASLEERSLFIAHMKELGIQCVFHYIPLHSSPAGERFGRFCGQDRYTTAESEKMVRLPMYYDIAPEDLKRIISGIKSFFDEH